MKADPNWPEVAQRRARYILLCFTEYNFLYVFISLYTALVRRKVKVLSRYKFYLAFENAPVSDYVSEKVQVQNTVWFVGR